MTYQLIDYERLKAFSEGLKSKYAKKTDISDMTISQFIDVYELDKSIYDAIKNDQNFINAINRDIFTLVTYDANNNRDFSAEDGYINYVFYKGTTIGVDPLLAQTPSSDKVIGNTMYDNQCFITQSFMNAYNKIIQDELKAVSPSRVSFSDLDSVKQAGLFFCDKQAQDVNGLLLNKVNYTGFIYQFLFAIEKKDEKKDFIVKARTFNGNSKEWQPWKVFWTSEFLIDKTAITDDFEKQSQEKVLSQKGANDLYVTLTEQYSQVVNSVNEQMTQKADKDDIPTKLSQLANDKNFKTEAEIQSMIEKASSLKKEVVTSLPTTGKADVIYLVKDTKGKDNNNYLEYLWLNGKYELIGSTQVDLSGYATSEEVQQMREMVYGVDERTSNVLDKNKDKAKLTQNTDWQDDTTYTTPYFVGQSVGTLTSQTLQSVSDYLEEEMHKKLDRATDKAIAPQDSNPNSSVWQDDNKYVTPKFLSTYVDLEISGRDETIRTMLGSKLNKSDIQEFTQQELEEAFR